MSTSTPPGGCAYHSVRVMCCFDHITLHVYIIHLMHVTIGRTLLAIHGGDYPAMCKLHQGQGAGIYWSPRLYLNESLVIGAYDACLFCHLKGRYIHAIHRFAYGSFRRWLPLDDTTFRPETGLLIYYHEHCIVHHYHTYHAHIQVPPLVGKRHLDHQE